MGLKRFTVAALAAVLALSGIGSILVMQHQPLNVDAVELDPAIRRQDDDGPTLELVDDDVSGGDGDDTTGDDGTNGGANTGDGDDTTGDDGTNGGANTGDGDDTAGDDGTGGGNNTADNTNTGGDTGGGDTTD
jgi:hypothetical protein